MRDWRAVLRDLANRLDIQRLSGIRTVLGIDLSGTHAWVVELERGGSPFDRLKASFKPLRSFSFRLEASATPQEKGLRLKEQLRKQGVLGGIAVVGIHGRGVRTAVATVPTGTTDIHEWIREHQEKLLKLPVRADELSFRFTAVKSDSQNPVVEITFIRTSDLEAAALTAKSAGLDLLSVEPGVDDLLLVMILGGGPQATSGTILYHDGSAAWILNHSEGRKLSSRQSPLPHEGAQRDEIRALSHDSSSPEPQVLLAGSFHDEECPSPCQPMSAFGLGPEYALASGLAIHGLLKIRSESRPLLPEVQRRYQERVYSTLWRRTVLGLGSAILLILTVLAGASWFVQSKIARIDEEIASAGPAYDELRSLQTTLATLQLRLRGEGATLRRTNLVQTLHEIARSAPEGLWFSKVELSAKAPGEAELQIHGFARSHQEVSLFLRSLERSPFSRSVRLVRSGAPEAEPGSSGSSTGQNTVLFHIAATVSS